VDVGFVDRCLMDSAKLVVTQAEPLAGHRHERSVRRAALTLTVANLGLFVAVWWSGVFHYHQPPTTLPRLAGFAIAFAVVGAVPMRLDFSAHQVTFTMTDAVLVAALFYLGAPWLGVAATLGELAVCALRRTPALKTLFNAASRAGAAAAAGAAFAAFGRGHSVGPASWLPALVAAACWSLLNIASVTGVLARAERRSYEQILARSIPSALGTTLLGSSLGLIAAELLRSGPLYPALLLPVAVGVALNNRYATAQRDEHLRMERLYDATARTAHLEAGSVAIATVADEARRLLTGTAAICCAREPSGGWVGCLARADGIVVAGDDVIRQIVAVAARSAGGASSMATPDGLRFLAPDAEYLVLAQSPLTSPQQVIVTVFRHTPTRGAVDGLHQTLSAFVVHGTVIADNARLLGDAQRSLTAQLEANRRKDEFVATVSHELRTPLTVMLGAAQTLLRLDGRLQPEQRVHFLHSAIDQGWHLQRLIEDLLLIAAVERGHLRCDMTTIRVEDLAEDLLADLPADARRHVRLHSTADGVAFVTDRDRLRQIVTNLVDNAHKYALGGPVEVEVSADDSVVSIAVVDHGPGIALEDRERAFERFVQLDQSATRSQGGTGIGLYLCRQLATQLGGSLTVEETVGGGCTFVLVLERLAASGLAEAAIVDATAPRTVGLQRRPALTPDPSRPERISSVTP
jgi:signal transduction histidine kinase